MKGVEMSKFKPGAARSSLDTASSSQEQPGSSQGSAREHPGAAREQPGAVSVQPGAAIQTPWLQNDKSMFLERSRGPILICEKSQDISCFLAFYAFPTKYVPKPSQPTPSQTSTLASKWQKHVFRAFSWSNFDLWEISSNFEPHWFLCFPYKIWP